jgi:RimJ/RimL family protein N-acetyltransferase
MLRPATADLGGVCNSASELAQWLASRLTSHRVIIVTLIFETERLVLRPVVEADRADLIALERDPEVMRFLNGGKPTPDDGSERETPYLLPRGHETDVWAAVEKSSGAFVGWFSLRRRGNADALTAVLGYRLRRSAWGRGYGSEGAKALVDRGFAELGFEQICAGTMAVNRASRRVLEKAGLVHVRTVHLDWPEPLPGSDQGDVEFEITREDWARQSTREDRS